ncbi:GL14320 [Drosophila persimilis]|uniref:Transcription initiation factor TFIID subunit 7-like n=3 Tax=pseudoobscura subgroup TaxID=32358 RepID=B5DJ86_DROPS|nr:transcription initiation factor TFIID subunit 7 [Drosophila pseudoobscura]EDW39829.1 GL14320 [Drosophila persimilis]
MEPINNVQYTSEPTSDEFEAEGQFIMRVPEDRAETIHEAIRDGNVHKKLSIALKEDLRQGQVWLDGSMLYTKLVDLPSIVESYKTTDKKNFYKTADISQMLICTEKPEEIECKSSESEEEAANKQPQTYMYPHGITRPLKNVSRRRFRKKMLNNPEMPATDIAKELKWLLITDSQAMDVKYEIINESDSSDHSSV